ncbi:hypothetical protein Srufu_031120 [Streptomyces libani subsp. rufus]|nr:hypothetical protein Srufu_031120 [Streptomyces libani subsp. rufus]
MGIFGGEGRLIGGRYRLGIRLGRGGMGTVWRATDEVLRRQVAVKELHLDEGTAEPEALMQRERAMREARTVAQIKHPNVIVVHDVVEQDGRPWIVMELVEGPSLADRLQSGGPVAPREAARIGVALLGALRAAHTRGVLHRDIKPANVLMESGTGRVVLTDFGIAQVSGVTTLTDAGGFVGSPEYTAPERMAGHGTGPEADLWSLGVLLCAALSGASPFHRDSLGGVLHAVVYDEIELPESARPLHAVVDGLLDREPERRLGVAETERLLRGYLQSGRAPERGTGGPPGHGSGRGHGGHGGHSGHGDHGGHGAGAAGLAAEAGRPLPGGPNTPRYHGPDVHAPCTMIPAAVCPVNPRPASTRRARTPRSRVRRPRARPLPAVHLSQGAPEDPAAVRAAAPRACRSGTRSTTGHWPRPPARTPAAPAPPCWSRSRRW